MTQGEKLEEAKRLYKDTNADQRYVLEQLFPELKESEYEKMVDFITNELACIRATDEKGTCRHEELTKAIAWLEKQSDKDNLIKELGKYKVKYTQEVLEKHINSMSNKDCERLKKTTIAFLKEFAEKGYENAVECIDWLEKLGEQKEINLVEILKHYPKETELYSPMYGKLWLAEVDEEHEIITCYKHCLSKGCVRAALEQEDTISFYSDGTTELPDFSVSKDCMLFLHDIEKTC